MNNDLAQMVPLSAAIPEGRFERVRRAVSGRMPELDGLRGLAILIVIWHNAGLTWYRHEPGFLAELFNLSTNMGWIGVQLFFVLSGFLITGILLDGRGRPGQLRNFYMRRALRILPLYFAVLFVAFVLLPLLNAMPRWLEQDRIRQFWYWTFLINWAEPFIGGGEALGHFWSLAVEEQFYLLWPLLVVGGSRSHLVRGCAALIVSAFVLRAAMSWYDPVFAQQAAYQFTVARWDALAIGALLAVALRRRELFLRLDASVKKLFWAVSVYILLAIAVRHNFAPVGLSASFNQSAAALWFSCLIFFALVSGPTRWSRALVHPLLRGAGKYSYALYVFHLPVIHVWGALRAHIPGWSGGTPLPVALGDIAAVCLLSTLLALLSWHALEAPFLRLKRFYGAR